MAVDNNKKSQKIFVISMTYICTHCNNCRKVELCMTSPLNCLHCHSSHPFGLADVDLSLGRGPFHGHDRGLYHGIDPYHDRVHEAKIYKIGIIPVRY